MRNALNSGIYHLQYSVVDDRPYFADDVRTVYFPRCRSEQNRAMASIGPRFLCFVGFRDTYETTRLYTNTIITVCLCSSTTVCRTGNAQAVYGMVKKTKCDVSRTNLHRGQFGCTRFCSENHRVTRCWPLNTRFWPLPWVFCSSSN